MVNIVDPVFGGEGGSLKPRDIAGLSILAFPIAFDPAATDQKGKTVGAITFKALILGPNPDGSGVLQYGNDLQKGTPHTHNVELPYLAPSIISSHVNIKTTLQKYLGTDSAVAGVIKKGVTNVPGNNAPWNLEAIEGGGQGPIGKMLSTIYAELMTGARTNPEPVEVGGAPAAVQVAQPAAASLTAAYSAAQPTAAQSKYAALPAGMAEATADAVVAAMGVEGAKATGIILAEASAPAGPPAGITPEAWAAMTPETRAAILNAPR